MRGRLLLLTQIFLFFWAFQYKKAQGIYWFCSGLFNHWAMTTTTTTSEFYDYYCNYIDRVQSVQWSVTHNINSKSLPEKIQTRKHGRGYARLYKLNFCNQLSVLTMAICGKHYNILVYRYVCLYNTIRNAVSP